MNMSTHDQHAVTKDETPGHSGFALVTGANSGSAKRSRDNC